MLELPPPSDSKGDDDNDTGDDGEGSKCLREEFHPLALLPFHVHENGLEKENIAHEGDRAYQEAQHGHRREDSVGLVPNERGAVGNEEHDEDDIEPGKKRIEIRIPGHALTIPNSTDWGSGTTVELLETCGSDR